jgi:hypothetical protein
MSSEKKVYLQEIGDLEKLPVPFHKMKMYKTEKYLPMRRRLFTETSSHYNSEMYCLLPHRPISKIFTKNITHDL